MMQILQGLLGMILGIGTLVFRPKIKDFTGDIAFAEQYLGSGGTWTLLLFIGIAIFLGSLMWATGTLQSLFLENFAKFF
jgi:hypothetical protein